MANVTITQLPAAGVLTGTELVPVVQNGVTVHTTTAAIAASPSLTQTFLTLTNAPTLPNSRYFSVSTGLGLTDNGAQSNLVLSLNGASGSLEAASNGVIVKTASGTVTSRTLTASGNGLSITNGSGVSGNPTFALTGLPEALSNLSGGGFLVAVDPSTIVQRSIAGTANEITVADGDGLASAPTIAIATDPVMPGAGGITLPSGSTAQRPVAPTNGTIRYNTDAVALEGYVNNAWGTIVAGVAVTSVDVSGGTTGLTTTGGPITSSGVITLGGTLNVANGGTGATTLTGYVKGFGTSAFTASATIPSTDITGLGTMSIQNANNVAITGGLINGVAIGGTTAAAGTFTNFDVTGTFKLDATEGNAGQIIIGAGIGNTPTWADQSSLAVGTATNLAGGAAGSIPYQTGSGVTAMLATSSGVLVGGTTPSYSTAPALTGTNFTSIPNGALQNSAITLGTTAISLGGVSLTLGGLTSVAVTQDPTTALQLTTKQYVDALIASGIHFHQPVRVESPINLNATYNNGTAGVGATLTNAGTQVALVIDGITLSVADRVLVYQQTNQTENGIYVVTDVGSGSTNWILTRSSDANTYVINSANGLSEGSTVFVQEGATGAGETYTCNTSGVITFGTTNITFAQISSAQIYTAGTGLTLTGTQFALTVPVVLANGGTGLTSYTAGDLPYFASGTAFSKLAIGVTDRILTSSGSAPQWTDPATVTVGTATSATSATNVAGGAANQIVFNTAASTSSFITAPTVADRFLKWTGSAFTWDVAGTGTVTSIDVSGGTTGLTTSGGPVTSSGTITLAGTLVVANGGTNGSATPTAGAVAYGNGTAYAFTAAGGSGDVLTSGGVGTPTWTSQSSLSVGSATNATNTTNIGITDDTSTNATMYPVWVTANTGNLPAKVTSTKLSFNPSTGVLTATGGISGGTF